MPKEQHAALSREATKLGLTGKNRNAFIYGIMRRHGWKPKREKTTLLRGKK